MKTTLSIILVVFLKLVCSQRSNLTVVTFRVPLDFQLDDGNKDKIYLHLDSFIPAKTLDKFGQTPLNELGLCVRFNLDVLLEQYILTIGTQVRILVNKYFDILTGNLSYLAEYPEYNPVLPNIWNHFCLSFESSGESNRLNIVLDGILLHDDLVNLPPLNLSLVKMNQAGLTLGFNRNEQGIYRAENPLATNLLHGSITQLNMWTSSLKIEDMIQLTTGQSCQLPDNLSHPDLFDWSKAVDTFPLAGSDGFVTKQIMTDKRVCYTSKDQENIVRLYPIKTNFYQSGYLCNAIGGKMFVPKDLDNLKVMVRFMSYLAPVILDTNCSSSGWTGIIKMENGSFVDAENRKIAHYLPFAPGQPNGRMVQSCTILELDSASNNIGPPGQLYDINCLSASYCSLCGSIKMENKYWFRGQIPGHMDRKYTNNIHSPEGFTGFAGFQRSTIPWEPATRSWNIHNRFSGSGGKNVGFLASLSKNSGSIEELHPIGLKTWNISGSEYRILLTQCDRRISFTCHHYGNCIPIQHRCDGSFNCPGDDMSDEMDCQKIHFMADTYHKGMPPRQEELKTLVNVSLDLVNIMEINELRQELRCQVRIRMAWTDNRLTFHNLRQDEARNTVEDKQRDSIWLPRLTFPNSVDTLATTSDHMSYLSIQRQGLPTANSVEVVNENLVYSGEENPLRLDKMLSMTLACKFDLTMFPFDVQHCPLTISVPFNLKPHVRITLTDILSSRKIALTQYFFSGFEIKDSCKSLIQTSGTDDCIMVNLKLKRDFVYHLTATYLPTLSLIVIAELTLFIHESHFEATIMVALTSKLVMYTLYQSVGTTLPQTSYLKMIDIWLQMGLIMPFFVILILMIRDSTSLDKVSKTNLGIDFYQAHQSYCLQKSYEGLSRSTIVNPGSMTGPEKEESKDKVVRWARNVIPVFTAVLILSYWIVAIYHYYSTF